MTFFSILLYFGRRNGVYESGIGIGKKGGGGVAGVASITSLSYLGTHLGANWSSYLFLYYFRLFFFCFTCFIPLFFFSFFFVRDFLNLHDEPLKHCGNIIEAWT